MIQCENSFKRILTSFEIFGAVFILFGVRIWALHFCDAAAKVALPVLPLYINKFPLQ